MRNIGIKKGGSVLVDEFSYQVQAEQLLKFCGKNPDTRLYVIVSAMKGETDRCIDEVAQPGDREALHRALKGLEDLPAYNNPSIAARLQQPEIESAYKLKKYLPDALVIDQNNPGFPVVANTNYLCGKVDIASSELRKDILDCDEQVVIVSGFGGVTPENESVLLGRNATDLVAACIARIAGFSEGDRLVYLKDVEGIYSDFGTPSQRKIERMSLDEIGKYGANQALDPRINDILGEFRFDIVIGHHKNMYSLIENEQPPGTILNRR